MKTSSMTPSKYLKKEDVERDTLVTITGLRKDNVAMADQEPELKWILLVKEFDRGLVLNTTNIELCSLACRSDETDDWAGQQIVLYNDPTVMFGGKRVGGIRIRPKRNGATPPPPIDDEDIPF